MVSHALVYHQSAGTEHVFAEAVEFCRFLEPTTEEAAMREAATQRVREVILSIWPQASVQVFGSFVTGICPCQHKPTTCSQP